MKGQTNFVTILLVIVTISVSSILADTVTKNDKKKANSSSSDSGKSESRLSQNIITKLPLSPSARPGKKVVSSQGYQLEVIEDNTSEESPQDRPGREILKGAQANLYPGEVVGHTGSILDDFLNQHGQFDDNSAKEDTRDDFIPQGKLAYGDIQPKSDSDITRVRDSFVNQEVNRKPDVYPPSSPLESNYKLEYDDGPIKYSHINTPILIKPGNLPLLDPASAPGPGPHPLPHHLHLEHSDDIGHGHEAGYGHGYHHHQQKLKSKPLKPSVVYRDPSDHFDHHDKIRTLDKDHLEKDHYGPHAGKGHDYKGYHHHGKVVFKPEYYDQTKVPECAHKNKYIYNLTFCLDDSHYPTDTIKWAIKEAGPEAKKLLSDVTYQSADNLVTGLTKAEEEGYTYKHYFGASHSQNDHLDKYKPPYHGYTYSTDYFKKGGYICPSDIYYTRPKRAMNTFGKWKVIINVDKVSEYGYDKYDHGHLYGDGHHDTFRADHHHLHHHEKPHHHDHSHDHNHLSHHEDHGHSFNNHGVDSYSHGHGHGHHSIKKREYKEIKKSYTQTVRLEQCIYSNAPCSYIDSHLHSRCIQKHNFVRLVAWTHEEGIHVDTFKMPIACSCHVRQPIHFYHESGLHELKHVSPVSKYPHEHQHPHHPHPPIEHRGLSKLY